jgi:septal ring factor EnvC (AmiA/AmiB activator)
MIQEGKQIISLQVTAWHKAYMRGCSTYSMDYSYRMSRLFTDMEELRERQKKIERYYQYLLKQKTENLSKLERVLSEQEKEIETLKERTELMARDTLRLKQHINKLTEVIETIMNEKKIHPSLETE